MPLPTLILAALLLAGLFLLKRARFPRPTGTDPHCPACNYNLTALASPTCPECGKLTSTPRIGARQRSAPLTFLSLALLLPALALLVLPLINAARTYNWYHLKPTSWVLADIRSTNPATAERAVLELDTRSLSPTQRQSLYDTALDNQQSRGYPSGLLRERLSRAFDDKKLSPAQRTRFLRQTLTFTLKARPFTIPTARQPWAVEIRCFSDAHQEMFRIPTPSATIDNAPADTSCPPYNFACDFSSFGLYEFSHPSPLGRHLLHVSLTYTLHNEPGSTGISMSLSCTPPASPPVWTETVELTAPFDVVPEGSPNDVRLLPTPSLTAILTPAIVTARILPFKTSPPTLGLELDFPALPIGVSYDAIARYNNHEYLLKGFTEYPHRQTFRTTVKGDFPPGNVPTINLILRPNPTHARNTLDLFEISAETSTLKNIPLTPAP
jgi:hypothetical protein